MNIWEFFDRSPILAFFAFCFLYGIAKYLLSLIKQIIRTPVLLKHGYPQPPYDADGDIHYPKTESEDK